MLEDVRNQLNQTKILNEGEMMRLESRLLMKLEDSQRNTEKYVSEIIVKLIVKS